MIFLWIYLIGIGFYFLGNTISLINSRTSVAELIGKGAEGTIRSAVSARHEVTKEKLSFYDAKLRELQKNIQEIKNLYSSLTFPDIFAGIIGIFASVLYIFSGIKVFYRSRKAWKFLNFANLGFIIFYLSIIFDEIFIILPKFRNLFAIVSDLIKIGDPQAKRAQGFMDFQILVMCGGFLVLYCVFYIFIPRYLLSRPKITAALR